MMEQAIRDFPKQFSYEPVVENSGALGKHDAFMVAGMGGSHLASGLLGISRPMLPLYVHRDYGLPPLPEAELKRRLFIASSYSGNTEEVIDALTQAVAKGLKTAAVSIGGELLEFARKHKTPYVQMPDTGIQPRMALGLSLRAQMKLMGDDAGLSETALLAKTLACEDCEKRGRELAQTLNGKVPVIYASAQNQPIAYNWKIKFNETGKIPAFYNVFSELNHNEMTGFDVLDKNRALSEHLSFIFLHDAADHPRIQKRMEITKKLYEDRGFPVTILRLEGEGIWGRVFTSLLTADWAALFTAQQYGAEAEQVPMVEEFKRLMKK
jgi:glucose/mannose-6-phosphate isomerase